jgi:hypothetical protein
MQHLSKVKELRYYNCTRHVLLLSTFSSRGSTGVGTETETKSCDGSTWLVSTKGTEDISAPETEALFLVAASANGTEAIDTMAGMAAALRAESIDSTARTVATNDAEAVAFMAVPELLLLVAAAANGTEAINSMAWPPTGLTP